jgi:hypothetical protein
VKRAKIIAHLIKNFILVESEPSRAAIVLSWLESSWPKHTAGSLEAFRKEHNHLDFNPTLIIFIIWILGCKV